MYFFNEQFWFLISFLIFVFLFYKPIKIFIIDSLDKKILNINNELEHANLTQKEAKNIYNNAKLKYKNISIVKKQLLNESTDRIESITNSHNIKVNDTVVNTKKLILQDIERYKTFNLNKIKKMLSIQVINVLTEYFKSHKIESISLIKNQNNKDLE